MVAKSLSVYIITPASSKSPLTFLTYKL